MLTCQWSRQDPIPVSNNGLTIPQVYKILHGKTELPRLDTPAFYLCPMFLSGQFKWTKICTWTTAYLDFSSQPLVSEHHMDSTFKTISVSFLRRNPFYIFIFVGRRYSLYYLLYLEFTGSHIIFSAKINYKCIRAGQSCVQRILLLLRAIAGLG